MPYGVKIIKADTLAEAWEKSVSEMMTNGHERFVKAPDYMTSEMDSPFFIMVENPMKEPRLHEKVAIQRDQAEEYARQMIFGIGDDTKENSFDYTYYTRFRWYPDCEVRADWPNVVREGDVQKTIDSLCGGKCIAKPMDQVQIAIDTLKKDPSRRSIVMITWIPSRDSIKFGPKREKSSSLMYVCVTDLRLSKCCMISILKSVNKRRLVLWAGQELVRAPFVWLLVGLWRFLMARLKLMELIYLSCHLKN